MVNGLAGYWKRYSTSMPMKVRRASKQTKVLRLKPLQRPWDADRDHQLCLRWQISDEEAIRELEDQIY